MRRTQDEIVADLRRRADIIETSARTKAHKRGDKIALLTAAQILRVAAEQNSFSYPEPAERGTAAMEG